MSVIEWAVQITVIVLLGATLPMAWRLDRMLRALRADRIALEQGALGLGEATQQAEGVLQRLRQTAEQTSRQIAERVAGADSIREDLRYLVERSESLADRLEAAVQAARPMTGATAAPATPVRSDAERDLMRALGMK